MQQLIEFAMNHPILSGIWVVLVLMLVYSFISGALSPVKELGTNELTQKVNKEDGVIVDIRSQGDFNKGHIVGSVHLPQDKALKGELGAIEKHKNKPIVVVCAMGMNAKRVAAQLLKNGFEQVFVLKGGFNSWTSAGLPVKK
ncbi:Thiosulfate sulfurtransferase [Saliniradius amylolyticus]|uniref:Thiosulfate sulfurtransferase n=1 Tax=Saliniradius amylolyticus TaxID=2183582 RepID=A0A2S2E6G0_9ALTE|nr:rhodanese-like domain-containing protein [Saliniradius amylolyticus]AWL13223.1 Thiosulfate sulfurtransferase [Saliniradius amylolyticus]